MTNKSAIDLCDKFLSCASCFDNGVHYPFDVGLTSTNDQLVVSCPEHGTVFITEISPPSEIAEMKCAECGAAFEDGKPHLH